MLNNNIYYHGIIRKTIVAFGNLFSNIYIDRKEGDSVAGTTIQRLQIPLSYAPKEKWLVRIEQDPTLENNTYVSLPRLSFEITGYSYDSGRKYGKMQKIICNNTAGTNFVFSPVPYNLSISLYVLTKTQEDAMQIIEQILPTFTPEYVLSVKVIDSMNVVQDIPIILNDVSVQDEYDGDFQTRRFVTHTLTFNAKINLFGPKHVGEVIEHVEANLYQNDEDNPSNIYTTDGDPITRVITESWQDEL